MKFGRTLLFVYFHSCLSFHLLRLFYTFQLSPLYVSLINSLSIHPAPSLPYPNKIHKPSIHRFCENADACGGVKSSVALTSRKDSSEGDETWKQYVFANMNQRCSNPRPEFINLELVISLVSLREIGCVRMIHSSLSNGAVKELKEYVKVYNRLITHFACSVLSSTRVRL